ncbi:ETX/MTX2 family pore-forming toxin [Streptomyces sp. NPDC039022]|uniref:ETX/MTX2 family pore-forming toxin n=1 Tax=Streptomyces sp. NPDC039022 TaxID=3157091 RepID=UPI0033FBD57C
MPTPTATLEPRGSLRHHTLEQLPQLIRHQPLNDSCHDPEPIEPNEMTSNETPFGSRVLRLVDQGSDSVPEDQHITLALELIMTLSLDEIVRKWADRTIAYYNKGKGSFSWSYATNWDHSKSDQLSKHAADELKKIGEVVVDYHYPKQDIENSWAILNYRELVNNTSKDQTQTATFKTKTTDTYSWKLGGGFKIGVEVSGKVDLPLIAEGAVKWSGEINFSAEHTSTITKEREWGFSSPVIVPARRKVVATQSINEQSIKIPFSASVKLKGAAAVQFDQEVPLDKNDPHHRMWFVDIGDIFHDLKWYNDHGGYGDPVDLTGYVVTASDTIIARVEGTMKGEYGTSSKVEYTESCIKEQSHIDASDESSDGSGGGQGSSWTQYGSRTFGA